MAVIPRNIYRRVEWQLHHAGENELQDQWLVDEAVDSVRSGGIVSIPAFTGAVGDKTAKAATLLMEKREKQQLSKAWLRCIRKAYAHYANSTTLDVVSQYYGSGKTILEVANQLHYDKQTINRYRDRFVAYVALLAASEGLISFRDGEA